jgi:hypothetical protein
MQRSIFAAATLFIAMAATSTTTGARAPAGDSPEVRFDVTDLGGAGATDLPVTLSALLAPGVFHDDDVAVVVRDGPGGKPAVVPAQIDRLSHHGDGSLQHALVTLRLDFAPHATHEVYLVPSPRKAIEGAFEATAPDAPVLVELADKAGAHWTAQLSPPPPDAPSAETKEAELRSGPVFGPLAQETARRARLRSGNNELPNVEVRVRWRRWSGVAATRVDVAVENCAPPDAKAKPDDVEFAELAILAGQNVVLADLKAGVLFDRTRLIVRGTVGAAPPRVRIREDPVYLVRHGWLPPFDFRHPLDPKTVDARVKKIVASDTTGSLSPAQFPLGVPFDSGPIVKYMPSTGDRGDIGPLPEWAVLALNSRSTLAEDALLAADGCGAAAFPIHVRDAAGNMGVDFEAGKALEARKNRIKCPLTHDRAHAPLLGYASFLLTGDVWAQEELAAEAAYCFHDWPHDGRFRYPGTRVFAWSLRTTMLAAKVLPDADPIKKYLGERLRANLAEVRGITQSPHPLHLWDNGGWEASARKSWVCATQASPWQLAWVAATADWTARLHESDGDSTSGDARAISDWVARYFTRAYADVGTKFTAPDGTEVTWTSGHYALAYSFPAATYQPERVGAEWRMKEGSVRPIDTFAEALWYLRVNLDHAFDPGKFPPLPDGPDGVATRAAAEWRPNAAYSPPPLPTPSWVVYSLHWLAAVLEAGGTKDGHSVWTAVRPCIEAQVAQPGMRMAPELWKR